MHWITKPTRNHIDRPSKPYEQNISDAAGNERISDRVKDCSPAIGNKQSADTTNESSRLHLPDAEETAREYCRRRNAGKWGLRKV